MDLSAAILKCRTECEGDMSNVINEITITYAKVKKDTLDLES